MVTGRIPHAAINTLMAWVRRQGKQLRTLTTWPQATTWMAHLELRGTRPLHARITPRGWRFTVARVAKEPTCPVCAGDIAPGAIIPVGASRPSEERVGFGGY